MAFHLRKQVGKGGLRQRFHSATPWPVLATPHLQ
jgi:hypothetical protein